MIEIKYARWRLSLGQKAGVLTGLPLAPRDVDDALMALSTVAARLQEAADPRAAFPDIYSIVTRKVAEEVRRRDGLFLEPRWISRLAGRFCERYLETLRWAVEQRPQDCGAWTATYDCSALPCAMPVQHVLLGLSAHINFDLALGIHETIVEFKHEACPEMLARYKHDYDQVNALLLVSVPEAFKCLGGRHGCPLSALIYARAYSPARWLTMQLLVRWRSVVWGNVCSLLGARTVAEREVVIARMARRSALYGRALKLPSTIVSAPFHDLAPLAQVIPLPAAARKRPSVSWMASLRSPERRCA